VDEQKEIVDIKGTIRRRKKSFIIPFLIVLLVAVTVAFFLPPIYLSKSTILIEEQQIPQEFVQTTITSYAEERLQIITQQIMSRAKLLEIMNQFSLYADMKDRYTTEEIIKEMRDDIHLETISADIIDRRTGRPTTATIAFSLSYEGKNPSVVQKVATVLASLYLEENLKSREKRATDITSFLQKEADDLKKQIDTLQNKISDFKQAHIGELPEHAPLNLQTIEQSHRRLDNLEMQARSLQERKIFLEGQLANTDPLLPVMTDEGKAMMNPKERLKYLYLQLVRVQGSYTDKHPDIIRIKREIKELEDQVGRSDDSIEKIKRLEDLKGQLASLKGKLEPNHPDVKKLSNEVELLSKEVDNLKTERVTEDVSKQKPDNPAYISLKTQLASTEMDIKSLFNERLQIQKKIADYEKKAENAPIIEKDYTNLLQDYESARRRYTEIRNKLMEAKVSQEMETSQRGERFTIIDPAQMPEKPYKPNRIAIIIIGFVLAIGAGVGLAAAKESLDTALKTADDFTPLTTAPVLSVIPLMVSAQERRRRRIKWAVVCLAIIGFIITGLYLLDSFVMPLDILWIKIQRRIMFVL